MYINYTNLEVICYEREIAYIYGEIIMSRVFSILYKIHYVYIYKREEKNRSHA